MLAYHSQSGMPINCLEKMRKKKFTFLLRKLAEQKKKENDEIERARSSSRSQSHSGGMKYLGL